MNHDQQCRRFQTLIDSGEARQEQMIRDTADKVIEHCIAGTFPYRALYTPQPVTAAFVGEGRPDSVFTEHINISVDLFPGLMAHRSREAENMAARLVAEEIIWKQVIRL